MTGETTPAITCVVPTLNSAATLDMTLQSLCNQTDIEVSVIVADSGSTDATLKICGRWEVPTVYVEPGNMYQAINAALRSCDTPWLTYVNSDDFIYTDSFARMVARGERTGAAVIYGNCDFCDVSGRFIYSFGAAKPQQLLALFHCGVFPFAQASAIFRRRVYRQLNGFDERFHLSADADFFLRAAHAGFRFARVDGLPVACSRLHARQLSKTRGADMMEEWRASLRGPDVTQRPGDWGVLLQWRLMNLGHDLLRATRVSLVSRRLRLPSRSAISGEPADFADSGRLRRRPNRPQELRPLGLLRLMRRR